MTNAVIDSVQAIKIQSRVFIENVLELSKKENTWRNEIYSEKITITLWKQSIGPWCLLLVVISQLSALIQSYFDL